MAWDFDLEMLLYLSMITAGFFMVPVESSPPYFLVAGIALAGAGFGLVYRKVKKK
ncbi:MAG: LPXTG cell wall anchor domain-containing protein [Thaumarchaeota archaeon]|nr:LPXTG cell wall anchor domain-containing protein [Nitrososphaerota archaeon]